MKIFHSIIFFLSLAFLIIGVHQTFVNGFQSSYWLFMLCLILFFTYRLLAKNEETKNDHNTGKNKNKGKRNR